MVLFVTTVSIWAVSYDSRMQAKILKTVSWGVVVAIQTEEDEAREGAMKAGAAVVLMMQLAVVWCDRILWGDRSTTH